jgi:hypothetical protein
VLKNLTIRLDEFSEVGASSAINHERLIA